MTKTYRPFLYTIHVVAVLLMLALLVGNSIHIHNNSLRLRAFELYKSGEYEDAKKLEHKILEIEESTPHFSIWEFIALGTTITTAILFIFLFTDKQRRYKKLLYKILEKDAKLNILSENASADNPKPTNLAEKELLDKITKSFEEEKIFTNQSLTIDELARHLKVSSASISKTINTYLRCNFPTLLNDYRIKEAVRLLTDPTTRQYKLEAIAEMCGYNNRQVFHSAFKRIVGVTPNVFKNMIKDNEKMWNGTAHTKAD